MARVRSYELRWKPGMQQGIVRLNVDPDPKADVQIPIKSAVEGALIAAILACGRAEIDADEFIGFSQKEL